MTTIPFEPRRESDALLAKTRNLPKDIPPAHDLWTGIEARLDGQSRQAKLRTFGWPAALAAGFLVAAVSAILTWGLMREPGPATEPGRMAGGESQTVLPVRYGPNSSLGATQLAARDELLTEFRGRFDELAPETREAVVRNLAVIQRAADEIDAALAQDPASGLLNGLLLGTYQEELQLYSKVVTAGDGSHWRT